MPSSPPLGSPSPVSRESSLGNDITRPAALTMTPGRFLPFSSPAARTHRAHSAAAGVRSTPHQGAWLPSASPAPPLSYLQTTTPRPPSTHVNSSPERPPKRIPSIPEMIAEPPGQRENLLTRDIQTIKQKILDVETKCKDAARVVYWMQVAGVVLSVVAPILGLFLAWWAVLPLIVAGAALYLISWYFSYVENKHAQEITPLSEQKELKNQELLTLKMMQALESRTEACKEEFKESFREFCAGIQSAISPYVNRLSLNPDVQKAMARLGIDAPRRRLAQQEPTDRKADLFKQAQAFLIENVSFLEEVVKARDYKSVALAQTKMDIECNDREIVRLVGVLKKKDASANKASLTSFWLRIAGVVAGVAGPILALVIAPWIAIPFVLFGVLTYFLSWHFTARQEADMHDIASLKSEIKDYVLKHNGAVKIEETILDLQEADKALYYKWTNTVISAQLVMSIMSDKDDKAKWKKLSASKDASKRESLNDEAWDKVRTAYSFQSELARFATRIVDGNAKVILDRYGIDRQRHFEGVINAFNYDPHAMTVLLKKSAHKLISGTTLS